MTPAERLKEIEDRYPFNPDGSVTKPSMTVQSVDKSNGVVSFTASQQIIYSEELSDIKWLINRVHRHTEALEAIDCKYDCEYQDCRTARKALEEE